MTTAPGTWTGPPRGLREYTIAPPGDGDGEDWLGREDSNLRSRDQNPLPCHLATPQRARRVYHPGASRGREELNVGDVRAHDTLLRTPAGPAPLERRGADVRRSR